MRVLRKDQPADGLFPIFIDPSSGRMSGRVTLGARGDSTFEYLVKQWVLAGGFRAADAMQQVAPAGSAGETMALKEELSKDGANRDAKEFDSLVQAASITSVGNPAYLVGEGVPTASEGETEPAYFASLRKSYDRAADGIHDHLLRRTSQSKLLYIAEKTGNRLEDKMDHLACFAGGMFALGA